jgi:predicted phosphodiesterase
MKAKHKNLLNSLINDITSENIDVIMITGDITWQCKADGYSEAKEWLTKLMNAVSVKGDHVIVCPGNHDFNQEECIDMQYQNQAKEVSKSLRMERVLKLSERFSDYSDWCLTMGFKKYKLGTQNDLDNYLVGSIEINGIIFWVLNSAWYAFNGGNQDKGNLWIGENFLEVLINQLDDPDKKRTIFALHHHPFDWLNPNETTSYSTSKNCMYKKLSNYAKCVFTGHMHAIPEEPNKFANSLYCFSTGATYIEDEGTYNNCCCVYNISDDFTAITTSAYIVEQDKWVSKKLNSIQLGNSDFPRDSFQLERTYGQEEDGKSVKDFKLLLENIKCNIIKVHASDFLVNRTVIWPVVPRLNLTNIHLAQLELMALLHKDFGWKVLSIITNCGAHPLTENEANDFIKKIRNRCDVIGINDIEFELLRDYYDNKPDISEEILKCFMKVSSELRISDLKEIKEKNYDPNKQSEIGKLPVLDYVVPALQYAVIQYISQTIFEKEGKKSIVIAGNDEKKQWSTAIQIIGDKNIGAILIPELNNSDGKNISQDTQIPDIRSIIKCVSKDELKEALKDINVAEWFYYMFVLLPQKKFTQINNGNMLDDKELLDPIWERIEIEN